MKADLLIQTVEETIEKHLPSFLGKKILVAFSGGADSVCLLHSLLSLKEKYGFSLFAAHVHHGLRGKEADRDESFVRSFCNSLQIPFFSERFDVAAYAQKEKLCIEDAGRRVRYTYFERLCKENAFDYIATAHHNDDNIETVLMRFLRGSGIHGLAGIPVSDERSVIRPLLFVDKTMILQYLEDYHLSFVSDSSNLSAEYLRNKLRLDVLPKLETINPNLRHSLAQNIRLYRETEQFLAHSLSMAFDRLGKLYSDYVAFPLDEWLKEAEIIRHLLLREAVNRLTNGYVPTSGQIFMAEEHILSKNGSFDLGKNIHVLAYCGHIYIYKEREKKAFSAPLLLDVPLILDSGTITIKKVSQKSPDHSNVFYLDADKVNPLTLRVRYRKNGDFFYPMGFGHKKTLQDYFIDCKTPRFLRDSIPLLVSDSDDIICVLGYRQDERFCAGNSKNIFEVTYTEDESLCIRM